MLIKILGWIWIISGIIFFLKPAWLQKRLQKKSTKKIRRWFFAIAFFLGVLLIKATWGLDGILPNIVMICGIIAIAKAFFFLKGKASEKVIGWFVSQPEKFYRVWSIAQIIFGFIILKVN